jgi:3-methyl-2-oxobutanoate hydroxymethyltransferase
MSVHAQASGKTGQEASHKPVSSLDILRCKGKRRIAVLTAYDYSQACIVDAAGMDVVLVGDSLGMVMLGLDDTMGVTLEDMISHTRSVVRGISHALVVADMPFMTYETGIADALRNAHRLCVESGVRAVKLEGGRTVAPQVKALVDAGIPVMGHIGLTPQRAAVLGGFKVQGKTASAAADLLRDALALQDAGCFSIVVEAVPADLATKLSQRLTIPTIGIGAGVGCDGQVLVYHDLLGLYGRFVPKFVKQYASLAPVIQDAIAAYAAEVKAETFPAPEHSFAMPEKETALLDELFDAVLREKR